MTAPPQSFLGFFNGFLLVGWLGGWGVSFGVFVVGGGGIFLKTMLNFPISYFHLPAQENSAVCPAVLLTFNTDIFEKTLHQFLSHFP